MQSEDTLSRPQISSPDGHENRAQNEGSEDSEGSEDIYRVSPEHEPEKYQDLILTETLPDIGQYFTCKDHPDVWNKDLKGLIISHFIPEHPLGEVAQDQNQ
jgi:hypothetical protein